MEQLKRKEMIEKLAKFRAAADKMSEDVYNISLKILSITSDLEHKSDKTPEEFAIYERLSELSNSIINASLNANAYNRSMWEDYTSVIKSLSSDSDGAR
ncbi:hypothetical protein [Escherichia coli]|uniref:hypothetical protein n=1 Tax=Escherichia coli TaxID=562 RepID=UPI000CE69118|nr:hypothetical protein [Escherichia coli]PPE50885.1 hypothetical protein C4M77_15685 [Escherichia coli]